jgi:hypothetical protein
MNGSSTPELHNEAAGRFEFDVALRDPIEAFRMILILENHQNTMVFHAVRTERELPQIGACGLYKVAFEMPPMRLTPGLYSFYVKMIHFGVSGSGRLVSDRALLNVSGDYDPATAPGVISPTTHWIVDREPNASTLAASANGRTTRETVVLER